MIDFRKANVCFIFDGDIIIGGLISLLFAAINVVNFGVARIAKDMVKEATVNIVIRKLSKELTKEIGSLLSKEIDPSALILLNKIKKQIIVEIIRKNIKEFSKDIVLLGMILESEK